MDIDLSKVKDISEEDLERILRDMDRQLYNDITRARLRKWFVTQQYEGIEK